MLLREFPILCLWWSSSSWTSSFQCCDSMFQWLSLIPRNASGSMAQRSVAIGTEEKEIFPDFLSVVFFSR